MTENTKPAIHITRRGLLVWIGLVVFIAGWMFVLGILVGRGTAPVALNTHKLETELTKLKDRMVQKEEAKVEAQASGTDEQKSELGFYEALKKGKPETKLKIKTDSGKTPQAVVAQAQPQEHASPQIAEPRSVREIRAPDKVAPAAEKKAGTEAEGPAKLQTLPARAPAAANAKGRFTVQVAAFKELDGAEHLVAELRRSGYPVPGYRNSSRRSFPGFRISA